MPTYEFECCKCYRRKDEQRTVERRNRIATCICGYSMSRVQAAPGIIFKGSWPGQDIKRKHHG